MQAFADFKQVADNATLSASPNSVPAPLDRRADSSLQRPSFCRNCVSLTAQNKELWEASQQLEQRISELEFALA